jgi:hypothetical protein
MPATRPPTWIAERRVVIVHPDGRRIPGHIAVGQPYTLAGRVLDPEDDTEIPLQP